MCGYNAHEFICCMSCLGSSPRVRVQRFYSCFSTLFTRIIPACAGTTSKTDTIFPQSQDHPRVCGYNQLFLFCLLILRGSSPRVRVQLESDSHKLDDAGIIPACAGTTSFAYVYLLLVRDHPRVCGYNSKKSHNFSDSQFYRSSFPFSLISFSLYIILTNLSFCLQIFQFSKLILILTLHLLMPYEVLFSQFYIAE